MLNRTLLLLISCSRALAQDETGPNVFGIFGVLDTQPVVDRPPRRLKKSTTSTTVAPIEENHCGKQCAKTSCTMAQEDDWVCGACVDPTMFEINAQNRCVQICEALHCKKNSCKDGQLEQCKDCEAGYVANGKGVCVENHATIISISVACVTIVLLIALCALCCCYDPGQKGTNRQQRQPSYMQTPEGAILIKKAAQQGNLNGNQIRDISQSTGLNSEGTQSLKKLNVSSGNAPEEDGAPTMSLSTRGLAGFATKNKSTNSGATTSNPGKLGLPATAGEEEQDVEQHEELEPGRESP